MKERQKSLLIDPRRQKFIERTMALVKMDKDGLFEIWEVNYL